MSDLYALTWIGDDAPPLAETIPRTTILVGSKRTADALVSTGRYARARRSPAGPPPDPSIILAADAEARRIAAAAPPSEAVAPAAEKE